MNPLVTPNFRSVLASACAALLVAVPSVDVRSADDPGVFIMGVDGMDPVILTRLMNEGKISVRVSCSDQKLSVE